MENVSEMKNTLVPIAINSQELVAIVDKKLVAIVDQHVDHVKDILAFLAENPGLGATVPDEFNALLSFYVYDDLKKYLEKSVMFAYITENHKFIETLMSVMKERNMQAELDQLILSVLNKNLLEF